MSELPTSLPYADGRYAQTRALEVSTGVYVVSEVWVVIRIMGTRLREGQAGGKVLMPVTILKIETEKAVIDQD